MFGWAIGFLIVAIVAAVFGFFGIAGLSVKLAWILFLVGLITSIVFFALGRRPPV